MEFSVKGWWHCKSIEISMHGNTVATLFCRVYVLTPQHQTPFGVSPRPSVQLNPEDFDALKVPQNLIGPEDENTCIEDK